MKILFLFITLLSFAFLTACDPYGIGFKKNPAYALSEAFEAINNQDVDRFLEVTGREALCLYGNQNGLQYLKETLKIDPENIEIDSKLLHEKRFNKPQFVGYWSYFNQRYMINIKSNETKKTIVEVIVDCDFGSEFKDQKFLNQNFKSTRFKRKECRMIKFMPHQFSALTLEEKCQNLAVTFP
jgi:hypothetical protein